MSTASPATSCRFPLTAPNSVTDPIVSEVYDEIEHELGFGIVPNIFRAMAVQPIILRATWDLFRATMLHGELPRVVKEMIGIIVSVSNNSEYALRVHLHSLGVQAVDREVLAALASGGAKIPGIAPSVAAILALVHKAVHKGPKSISDDDVLAVEKEGVTQEELAEVFATIHLFQFVNSFTDLVRVPVDAL